MLELMAFLEEMCVCLFAAPLARITARIAGAKGIAWIQRKNRRHWPASKNNLSKTFFPVFWVNFCRRVQMEILGLQGIKE